MENENIVEKSVAFISMCQHTRDILWSCQCLVSWGNFRYFGRCTIFGFAVYIAVTGILECDPAALPGRGPCIFRRVHVNRTSVRSGFKSTEPKSVLQACKLCSATTYSCRSLQRARCAHEISLLDFCSGSCRQFKISSSMVAYFVTGRQNSTVVFNGTRFGCLGAVRCIRRWKVSPIKVGGK